MNLYGDWVLRIKFTYTIRQFEGALPDSLVNPKAAPQPWEGLEGKI